MSYTVGMLIGLFIGAFAGLIVGIIVTSMVFYSAKLKEDKDNDDCDADCNLCDLWYECCYENKSDSL